MAATNQSIRAAILAALQPLLQANNGRFASVLPYAGQITPGGNVDLEALGELPAAFVALERERFGVAEIRQSTLVAPVGIAAGESTWVVLLAASHVSSRVQDAVELLDACVDDAIAALNGTVVDGTFEGQLSLIDSNPIRAGNGILLHAIRVAVRRTVAGQSRPATAISPWSVTGDVNVVDTDDPAPNPITRTKNEIT